MEGIKYEATDRTPFIEGSITTGEITIRGRSYPEDAPEFFQPFRDWLPEFYQKTPAGIHVILDLDYMNTATTTLIYDIIHTISDMSEKRDVKVTWKYEADDYDMIDKGKDFQDLLGELLTLIERGDDVAAL